MSGWGGKLKVKQMKRHLHPYMISLDSQSVSLESRWGELLSSSVCFQSIIKASKHVQKYRNTLHRNE